MKCLDCKYFKEQDGDQFCTKDDIEFDNKDLICILRSILWAIEGLNDKEL